MRGCPGWRCTTCASVTAEGWQTISMPSPARCAGELPCTLSIALLVSFRLLGWLHTLFLYILWRISAHILLFAGKYIQAEPVLHEVLSARERELAPDHPDIPRYVLYFNLLGVGLVCQKHKYLQCMYVYIAGGENTSFGINCLGTESIITQQSYKNENEPICKGAGSKYMVFYFCTATHGCFHRWHIAPFSNLPYQQFSQAFQTYLYDIW